MIDMDGVMCAAASPWASSESDRIVTGRGELGGSPNQQDSMLLGAGRKKPG